MMARFTMSKQKVGREFTPDFFSISNTGYPIDTAMTS